MIKFTKGIVNFFSLKYNFVVYENVCVIRTLHKSHFSHHVLHDAFYTKSI